MPVQIIDALTHTRINKNISVSQQQVAMPSGLGGMVRPVTGTDVGIRRAEIRPGLREVILCKDQDRKVGLRFKDIDNVSNTLPKINYIKLFH